MKDWAIRNPENNRKAVRLWRLRRHDRALRGRWGSNRCRCEIKRSISLLKANKINGGTRKEMTEVIDMFKELKTRVWKIFTLDETKESNTCRRNS